MGNEQRDDRIDYHREAIRHHEREIVAMVSGGLKHFHAGPNERLDEHDVTDRMREVAEASKRMHERLLVLVEATI